MALRWKEIGPTTRAVVVYGRSGARSTTAAQILKQAGYAEVLNLGPMSAW
jgi:rhodanese-related sulfurtransferase